VTHADQLNYSPITQPSAPVLWYKFDETAPSTAVADSSGNGYAGTVVNYSTMNWSSSGGRSGGPCLNIPIVNPSGTTGSSTYIEAAPAAVSFMTDGLHSGPDGGSISFTMWANASLGGDILYQWPGIFGVWNSSNATETVEVPVPSRIGPSGTGFVQGQVNFIKRIPPTYNTGISASAYLPMINFGGRWNHWAFVKSPYSLQVYCNGNLVAHNDANGIAGDPNAAVYGPLFPMPNGDIHIGTRGHNWAMWSGKLADFKIYNYALSAQEVQYEATDGTGSLLLPLTIRENLKVDGTPATEIVNLKDLALMGQQWHQQVLWP